MTRRLFHRGILSIENEDPTDTPNDSVAAQDVAVAEAGEELANGVLEQTESEVEGEAREVEIEDASEIVESLEALAVFAKDSARGQGFSRETAHAVNMQYEFLRKRLHDHGPSKFPSMESFGATTSRIRGTTASFEEISDLGKRAWAAIVEKVKAAFKWVRDHFVKVFGNAERLQKRAVALKAKVEDPKLGTIEAKTFDNQALVGKIYTVSGTAPDAQAVASSATTTRATVEGFMGHAFGISAALATAVETGLKSATGGSEFTVKGIALPQGYDAKNLPDSYAEIAKNNGTQVGASAALPGGKVIAASVPGENVSGADALKSLAGTRAFVESVKETKAPTTASLATLDRAQMSKIVEEIEKLAEYLVNSRKSVDEVNKKRDNLERALDSFAREFEKADKDIGAAGAEGAGKVSAEDQKKNASAAKSLVSKLPTVLDFGVGSVTAYAITTGSAMLDYVGLSLRNYKAA